MADEIKISGLPANPQSLSETDLLPVVQNVSGTLTTVKVQYADFQAQFMGTQDYVSMKEITPLTDGAQKTPVEINGVTYTPFAMLSSGTTIAEYQIKMPMRYDLGEISGELTCFTPGTTGDAVLELSAAFLRGGAALPSSFGSGVNVTIPSNASANFPYTATFSGLVPSGSPIDRTEIVVRITRSGFGGSDTLNNVLYLNQFMPQYTADQGNDNE